MRDSQYCFFQKFLKLVQTQTHSNTISLLTRIPIIVNFLLKNWFAVKTSSLIIQRMMSFLAEVYVRSWYNEAHGRRKGVGKPWPSWILKISAKKGYFLSFEWEKQISLVLALLEKFWKKPLWPPWKKSFRHLWWGPRLVDKLSMRLEGDLLDLRVWLWNFYDPICLHCVYESESAGKL